MMQQIVMLNRDEITSSAHVTATLSI